MRTRFTNPDLTPALLLFFDSVQFDYDNGFGSKVDRFSIDLYKADGTGECGSWVASICDKPAIGCKDSSENKTNEVYTHKQINTKYYSW